LEEVYNLRKSFYTFHFPFIFFQLFPPPRLVTLCFYFCFGLGFSSGNWSPSSLVGSRRSSAVVVVDQCSSSTATFSEIVSIVARLSSACARHRRPSRYKLWVGLPSIDSQYSSFFNVRVLLGCAHHFIMLCNV